jgi:hypothetical protein
MAIRRDIISEDASAEPSISKRGNSFFPVPEDFAAYIGVNVEELKGARKVLVSLEVLRSLIGMAAGSVAYNADYYETKYQDLADAKKAGLIHDLYSHYVSQGYFEKRVGCKQQAFPVDENWYLEAYPDVASGIKAGTVESAADHYFTTGRREGRLPSNTLHREVQHLIATLTA